MNLPASPHLERLWTDLATRRQAALLLDYDGTLAPFQTDPAQARPYPGIEPLLDRIGGLPNDRLIIVSGRWLNDLRPLLKLSFEPEMWGCHGRERRLSGGQSTFVPLREAAAAALAQADDWEDAILALGGRVERKPGSIAFHWRELSADRRQALRQELSARFAMLTPADELIWHEFDGGVELRASGADKGQVVRQVLAEMDTHGDYCMAYLGDDYTDEDAFTALGERGFGILVKTAWRNTAASTWLRPPEEVIAFLTRWLEIRSRQVESRGMGLVGA
ncbi:MAG TPA: trehalose-phosphatase [Candidatus Macondimonas sp.]|jgi:trehalose-phosphatase|nr:trehalose-phosphatase [Candidatus Macondimonas sp.]